MSWHVVTITICDICGVEDRQEHRQEAPPKGWAIMNMQDSDGSFISILTGVVFCPACLQNLKNYLLHGGRDVGAEMYNL